MESTEFHITDSSVVAKSDELAFSRWVLFGLMIIVFCTIWLGLDATRLWDRDEPRNAGCASEMLERGDWIVPVFNGELRTHKPILLYWLQMASFRLLGHSDFAARAASGLMASLSVLATYWLGKSLFDRATGFWSAAALATSLMFVVAGRAATPDACLIATSTLGVLFLVRHWQSNSRRMTRFAWGGYVALGLAVLAKGPVGVVLPLLVVALWGWSESYRSSFEKEETETIDGASFRDRILAFSLTMFRQGLFVAKRFHFLIGILVVLGVSMPWYVWVGIRTDGEWLRGFFIEHNYGRAVSAMEGHRGGWWFYPAASIIGLFPWSLLLIPIGMWAVKHVRDREFGTGIKLGLIWLGVYVVVFSMARTKLPSYITPSYPGAALVIGSFLSNWSHRKLVLSTTWLTIAAFVVGFTGMAISSVIGGVAIQQDLPEVLPHLAWGAIFLIVSGMMVWSIRYGRQSELSWTMLSCAVVFLGGLFAAAGPAVSRHRNDLDAILTQRTYLDDQGFEQPTRWMSLRTIEPSWIYYLGAPILERPSMKKTSDAIDEVLLSEAATHLRNPSGRLIVDAERVIELSRNLEDRYRLKTMEAVEFQSFLKENRIVVLKGRDATSLGNKDHLNFADESFAKNRDRRDTFGRRR